MNGRGRAAPTLAEARRDIAHQFRAAGLDSPELDAQLLAGAALGLDLTGLSLSATRELTKDEIARLGALAQRRIAGEPVARILGVREFWSLPLRLSAETLIPRPDTETVVTAGLDLLRAKARPVLADIGTGSGAILLALLSERADAFGVGVDISFDALTSARANATALGLADRASFVAGDYAAALAGPFDLIVSNPPYIATHEIDLLEPDVRDHDPRRALDGGADGLQAYRRLAAEAGALLKPDGALLVEVGHRQADDVTRLFEAAGLRVTHPHRRDLAGVPRVVEARKTPG